MENRTSRWNVRLVHCQAYSAVVIIKTEKARTENDHLSLYFWTQTRTWTKHKNKPVCVQNQTQIINHAYLFSLLTQSDTQTDTLMDKSMCQLSGLLAWHDKVERSESLLLFQLPVSVCRYSPAPFILCSCISSSISCLYESLSADKSFIPWRPVALQLGALLHTLLFAWEWCVMSCVHMTLFWHCGE